MRKIQRICAAFLSAALILLSSSFIQISAQEKVQKRILFISSYSYSWGTVPQQIKGIAKEFDSDDYVVNYEFMDTKNTSYSQGYQEYHDLLKYKLSKRQKYDGVIAGDDAALNFVEQYRSELFADIPFSFLAVDNISNAEQACKEKHVSGVVEKVNYAENISIAQKLLPKAKNVVFIFDNKENGIGIAEQLEAQENSFPDLTVDYVNTSELTKEELCDRLASFTSNDIVLFVSMGQLKDNVLLSESERYQMVRDYGSVPFFRVSTAGVGEGALGGYVVDFTKSAVIAADMMKQMLADSTAAAPAMEYQTPCHYFFDYAIIQKYKLDASVLPSSTIFIHRPVTFWRQYSNQIIIVLLIALLFAYIVFDVQLRRGKQELKKKNEELIKANQAKFVFLSNMSHDVRTPMNAIMGIATLLEKTKDPDEIQTYVKQVEQSGRYMLSLINDALDMSKIESGKMTLHPKACNRKDLCSHIMTTVQALADQKGVTFVTDIPADDDKCWSAVYVDPSRIDQIFMNLLSNAVKFTPPGGTVTLKMVSEDINDKEIISQYTITDTGIGMSEEFQKHLYEPFNQENQTYSTRENGTGLGLAIVKELVDLMHGTIQVTSSLGKGTQVDVKLHMTRCEEADSAEKIIDDSVLQGKHVLLCEDNPLNSEIAGKLLEMKGITAEKAANGQIAVDIFTSRPSGTFDAILMDIRMPVLDGVEATKKIRALEDHPDAKTIPIISLTANHFEEDIRIFTEAGMNAHIAKPIDANELFRTLTDLLQ